MGNNFGDDFNFCLSFKMALQLRTALLGQLRDIPLSAVEWDIIRSRPQPEESPTKSPNTASLEIAAKEAVECWKVANKVDFVDFAMRMNRLEVALLLQV